MTFEEIINRIKLHGTVTINSTKDIAHGKSISLSNGGIINCYNTGKHVVQGKNQDETKVILGEGIKTDNRKIFVVYGHDDI